MGSLKDKALETKQDDVQVHELTDQEYNYLKILHASLQYHTLGSNIQSGFLYYICTNRLGYKHGVDLAFELDFDKDDKLLSIKELPESPAPAL